MDQETKVLRGQHARHLLADELLNEAISGVRKAYEHAAAYSKDQEKREDAYKRLCLLDQVVGHLRSFATTGELTRKEIEDINRRKRFGII